VFRSPCYIVFPSLLVDIQLPRTALLSFYVQPPTSSFPFCACHFEAWMSLAVNTEPACPWVLVHSACPLLRSIFIFFNLFPRVIIAWRSRYLWFIPAASPPTGSYLNFVFFSTESHCQFCSLTFLFWACHHLIVLSHSDLREQPAQEFLATRFI